MIIYDLNFLWTVIKRVYYQVHCSNECVSWCKTLSNIEPSLPLSCPNVCMFECVSIYHMCKCGVCVSEGLGLLEVIAVAY